MTTRLAHVYTFIMLIAKKCDSEGFSSPTPKVPALGRHVIEETPDSSSLPRDYREDKILTALSHSHVIKRLNFCGVTSGSSEQTTNITKIQTPFPFITHSKSQESIELTVVSAEESIDSQHEFHAQVCSEGNSDSEGIFESDNEDQSSLISPGASGNSVHPQRLKLGVQDVSIEHASDSEESFSADGDDEDSENSTSEVESDSQDTTGVKEGYINPEATANELDEDSMDDYNESIPPSPAVRVAKIPKSLDNVKKLYDKRSICIFCKKGFTKLPNHLETQHPKETLVISFLKEPKNSAERREIIAKIRKLGNEIHNSEVLKTGEGFIIPKYRKRTIVDPKSLEFCAFCHGMYTRSNLSAHIAECREKRRDKVTASITARPAISLCKGMKPAPVEAQGILAAIFRTMRIDDTALVAQQDPTIRQLGINKWLELGPGSSRQKNFDIVKARLRLCGNFLIAMRDVSGNKTMAFEDIFVPKQEENLYKAVWKMSGFCEDTFAFKKPSLAHKIGQLLEHASAAINYKANIEGDSPKRHTTMKFMEITRESWRRKVGKNAYTAMHRKHFNKPLLIPLTEDIVKANNYLNSVGEKLRTSLLTDPNCKDYLLMQKNAMARVIYFNRRRVGDVEAMELEWVPNADKDLQSAIVEDELFNDLSEFEQHLVKVMKLAHVRGKQGRKVPILLTEDLYNDILLLIDLRKDYGPDAKNIFLFGQRGPGEKHLRGSPIMRNVALECKAKKPMLLTGTLLRKHIATCCQVLALPEHHLQSIASFMGHHLSVHFQYYRLPQETMQLAKVSKLFLAASTGSVNKYKNMSLDDIVIDPMEEVSVDDTERQSDMEDFVEHFLPDEQETEFDETTALPLTRGQGRTVRLRRHNKKSEEDLSSFTEEERLRAKDTTTRRTIRSHNKSRSRRHGLNGVDPVKETLKDQHVASARSKSRTRQGQNSKPDEQDTEEEPPQSKKNKAAGQGRGNPRFRHGVKNGPTKDVVSKKGKVPAVPVKKPDKLKGVAIGRIYKTNATSVKSQVKTRQSKSKTKNQKETQKNTGPLKHVLLTGDQKAALELFLIELKLDYPRGYPGNLYKMATEKCSALRGLSEETLFMHLNPTC
ncbi:UNVERIFIED_CONTAM: hypothetical protein B566_EDAN014219 [Ephemera danica]|nr:hypothetical protein B566_EDAN014219 [Ephemera danica]